MSQPLSPRSPSTLNCATPLASNFGQKLVTSTSPNNNANNKSEARLTTSSPFDTEVGQENTTPVEDFSPLKSRGTIQRSPTKDFVIHEDETSTRPIPPIRSLSPSKSRSSSYSSATESPEKASTTKTSSLETIPLEQSLPESKTLSTSLGPPAKQQADGKPGEEEEDDIDTRSFASDDTRFSAFSAVPNVDMTLFAKLGMHTQDNTIRSPTRRIDSQTFSQTPTHHVFMTPSTSKRRHGEDTSRPASPTPRQHSPKKQDDNTTNLLLDFTQQWEGHARQSSRSPTKSTTEPNLLSYLNNQRNPSPSKANPRTPGKKSLMNLLDFDLPPQPTPRSVPTITIRELESMKSNYLSEISSLKASLSGRQAEVDSLKKAVGDAEHRVGEAQESLRDERSAREYAEASKTEWEKKGRELESLLKNVREEFESAEKEREELLRKLEESNRARDEAELKAAEVATKANVAQSEIGGSSTNDSAVDEIVSRRVEAQIDEKLENLARELHGVYKKKHESKVSTLKKTYEARADKKCSELQAKIDELAKQNEELQATKDTSLSREFPTSYQQSSSERSAELQRYESQKAELEEQKAKVVGLMQEMTTMKEVQAQLALDLESERVEKGELVAAVDEMLALQIEQSEVGASQSVMEDFRRSISKPSGLRGPGFGESRIAKAPGGVPQRSMSSGKSRMMSNIERMGGRGE